MPNNKRTTKTTTATNVASKTATPKLATVMEESANDKTGLMSATYTGYQTCPDTCELKPVVQPDGSFKQGPCYASCDFVGFTMHRLTTASVDVPLIQIQKQECDAISKLSGKQILRLKVGGDTPNTEYAEGLATACKTYSAKHNQPAFGYTHNWLNIPRESFGSISMLASCDNVSDIAVAKERGYATATVVSHFPNGNKLFIVDGHKLVPCPEQVASEDKPIQCVDCKLCCNDANLRKHNITIAFEAHGRKADQLKATLQEKGV